ncbi:type II toxin-antitoxin system death-on-curing family toxin [Candidatus Berkelbacteria bacterium CG08_land_8_20_14_0_20_39_8]|uniref:Type II toxin-antitoxin system death-on-curing family toxin n=1 Tax=Candidatus Berkelbacteria bacterium CG08_land_8_20_14_0_20_39_8 TaxID=1974511 RepID=A0A2M6YCH2_9BACT|nr:MAG: type II toxin-antitoxin system death-on-curing family toxin [Candidatus Berkelbacteria bacterium CG08_land_8_20_14_0_20_39_8]
MIFKISIEEVELTAHRLAKLTMSWDEPIPDFSTRYPNVLESCLATPFQSFARKDLYPTLAKKAAILFYLMIKNHPFQNGNKRIAVTTLFTFFRKNSKWLSVDNQELYNFAVWVASSPAEFQEEILAAAEKFIKKNLVEIK